MLIFKTKLLKHIVAAFILLLLVDYSGYSQSGLLHQWTNVLRNKQPLGGDVFPGGIAEDNNGNIWVGGHYRNHISFPTTSKPVEWKTSTTGYMSNGFIAKYNENGAFLMGIEIVNDNPDGSIVISNIATTSENDILVTGFIRGIIDFDKNSPLNPVETVSEYSVFFAKYSSSGNFIMSKILPGSSITETTFAKIMPLNTGGFVLTGSLDGNVDIDPGPNVLRGSYSSNTFFAWYDQDGNLLRGRFLGGFITSYDLKGAGIDSEGNLHLAGTHGRNQIDFDPGPANIYVNNPGYLTLFVFAKYNSNGDFVYVKKVGNATDVKALTATMDSSGHFNIICLTQSTTDFDPDAGTYLVNNPFSSKYTMCFARYSSSGTFVSAYRLAHTTNADDIINANSIAIDTSGNCVLGGNFSGSFDFDPGNGQKIITSALYQSQMFIARYNKTGGLLYASSPTDSNVIGSSPVPDKVQACMVDSKNRIWITGFFTGCIQFGANTETLTGFKHTFLIRSSTEFVVDIVTKIGRHFDIPLHDEGNFITADKEGNLYVAGGYRGSLNMNANGDEKIIGDTISGCNDFINDPKIFLAKYNKSGQLIFAKSLIGIDFKAVMGLILDSAGNILITGRFLDELSIETSTGPVKKTTNGESDLFFAKFTNAGELIFLYSLGNVKGDESFSVATDKENNIIITGKFYGTVDFDPGPNTFNLNSGNLHNLFVAKYNSQGEFIFAKRIITTLNMYNDQYNSVTGINSDEIGNIYITGYFNSTVNFNNGNAAALLSNTAYVSMFFAKYNPQGEFIYAKKIAYPYGSSDYATVESSHIQTFGSNIYIAGFVRGLADFDPGPATHLESSGFQYSRNGFVARYDSNGNYINVRVVTTNQNCQFFDLKVDHKGNLLSAGYNNEESLTINFSNTTFTGRTFIAKFDSTLNLLQVTGFDYPYINGVVLVNGNIYSTGKLKSNESYDVDPGPSIKERKANNGDDLFIAKFTDCGSIHRTKMAGAWNDPATWENGGIPSSSSCVIVSHNITLSQNTTCRTLTIQTGGNISISGGVILEITD